MEFSKLTAQSAINMIKFYTLVCFYHFIGQVFDPYEVFNTGHS